MSKLTMLYKQNRIRKIEVHTAIGSAKHHLLLDAPGKRKQQRISSLSHRNLYKFKGKLITTEEEKKDALEHIENLFKYDNNKFNFPLYRKVKYKFRKWLNSANATHEEKKLFQAILRAVDHKQSKPLKFEPIINRFSKLENVSRFNDKKKALSTIVELQNQCVAWNLDHGSQLSCALVDIILTIPKHNKHELTAEELAEILTSYYEKNFPQFPIVLVAMHKDEIVPHVHIMIDAKNKNTDAYDYVQTQCSYIRNKYNSARSFNDLYSKCTAEEVSQIGELLQTDFYDYMNSMQQKHTFSKKEYLSLEHKRLEREKIALDTNKPIADREFNTATYLAELKRKCENSLVELEKERERSIETARSFKSEGNRLKKSNAVLVDAVKSQKIKLKQLESKTFALVETAMLNAAAYAKSLLDSPESPFKQSMRNLHDIDEKLAFETLRQALLIQPTGDKKEVLKHDYDNAIGSLKTRRK